MSMQAQVPNGKATARSRLRHWCGALLSAGVCLSAPALAMDFNKCTSNWHVWMKDGGGYRPAQPGEVIIRGARKWDTDHWVTHNGNPPPLNVPAPSGEVAVASGGPLRGCELALMLEVAGKGSVELLTKVDLPDLAVKRQCTITMGDRRYVIDPWHAKENPESKCYVIKGSMSKYDRPNPHAGETHIYLP